MNSHATVHDMNYTPCPNTVWHDVKGDRECAECRSWQKRVEVLALASYEHSAACAWAEGAVLTAYGRPPAVATEEFYRRVYTVAKALLP